MPLLAGCTVPEDELALEATGAAHGSVLQGAIVVGDAFDLLDARLTVAARNEAALGTEGAPVALADPPELARTPLQIDHWVLEATLRERTPGLGAGVHRARLDWNGEPAGSVYLEGENATRPLGVIVRFDVGATLKRSNVYAFELLRTP